MAFVKLEPVEDYIIYKRHPDPNNVKRKIMLSSGNEAEVEHFIAIAVGPGRMLDNGTRLPMATKVGDIIFPDPAAQCWGTMVTREEDGKPVCLVRERELAAFIVPDTDRKENLLHSVALDLVKEFGKDHI